MGKVLLIAVCVMFFVVLFNFWLCVVVPWTELWFGSTHGLIGFSLLHTLLFLTAINYYKAATVDPGYVPKDWTPVGYSSSELDYAIVLAKQMKPIHRRYYSHPVRFCTVCDSFKPPRSHHCNECNRCLQRMDHHCYFLNACIAYYNHKFFISFMVGGFVSSLCLIVLHSLRAFEIIHLLKDPDFYLHPLEGVGVVSSLLILLVATLLLGSILFPHLTLLFDNTTTIEVWERHWANEDIKLLKSPHSSSNSFKYQYPYDKGRLENFREVFGVSQMTWCLPLPPEKDGLNYPPIVPPPIANLLAANLNNKIYFDTGPQKSKEYSIV
eukprot:TRINITY_DN8133_c0_g1_i1.p1 TRINITY_DN8133_c0_g1~~TRINITY_DN8133_c0_g1_i1.p1  ORF type:complete len:324 (-),score=32.69 TRINITY_DN8133_c0_g1_i1:91-1062(-)